MVPSEEESQGSDSPWKTRVLPTFLPSSQTGDWRREEPGEESKADISAASRERKGKDHRNCRACSNTGRAIVCGSLKAPRDLIRCHVCRLRSQSVASCLSNSISIQGDKLSCSRTKSVHFLNNQHPGNNMRTSKYQPMDKGQINPWVSLEVPWPKRNASDQGWGKGAGFRRQPVHPKRQMKMKTERIKRHSKAF